jgi:protein-tyrosine phosphatase
VIDLHCHILPGIDDGSPDLTVSLEMARIAVGDGITTTACTPHIYPGLFENRADGIRHDVARLRHALDEAIIPLTLTHGADIQIVPELTEGLQGKTHPCLGDTRYFLLEPPHHAVPVRFNETIHDCLAFGYVPVITHPERLTWLDDDHYGWFLRAAEQGAWIQVTAGALTGRFGRTPKYWGERMLDDGIVHILATDAHDPHRRPPILSEGRDAAVQWVGADEAERLVTDRPAAILQNAEPRDVVPPPRWNPRHEPVTKPATKRGLFGWLTGRRTPPDRPAK